ICERNFFEDAFRAILVERRPATVSALEGQHPIEPALESLIAASWIAGGDFAQRQQNHRRIIDIRVPFIVEFKDPSAWFNVRGIFVMPIAAKTNFPVDEPIATLDKSRMITGKTGFVERNRNNRRIPNR